ncbi:MAG: hypothetical protein ACLFQX_04055 [Candidatus Kapaibacterium sp.]
MNKPNENPNVFPALVSRSIDRSQAWKYEAAPAMTLLDEFAGRAMQTLLSLTNITTTFTYKQIAAMAYEIAEEMLNERITRMNWRSENGTAENQTQKRSAQFAESDIPARNGRA